MAEPYRLNHFSEKRFENLSSIPGTYVVVDSETGERLSSIDLMIAKLNELEDQLRPIRDVCIKYNIELADLPDTLEEYIAYDNAEYLEKLQNQ